MSYEEVEMGLPPVNEVNSPTSAAQQRQPPRRAYEDIDTDTPQSSLERNPDRDRAKKGAKGKHETPEIFKVQSSQIDPQQQRAPQQRQRDVYALEETNSDMLDLDESDHDALSRARKYGGFVLILLPTIFGAFALQFIKYLMNDHRIQIIALCVFQGILWPSVFFIIYTMYWMKRPVMNSISYANGGGWQNMAEISLLSTLASFAVIFQIVSVHHIDITVSLAISFSPLILTALIEHISSQKRFSIELIFTSLIAYSGLVLVSMAALTTGDFRNQQNILIGIGSATASMTLTIPAALLLSRLRRKKVEDSLTGAIFAFTGTLISLILIGTMVTLHGSASPRNYDANPGLIAALVAFLLCATFFQILDSIYRSPSHASQVVMMISATRMGIFVFSSIWELLKRGFFPGEFLFPSVFSIFGVILLLVSYALTVGFQAWYKDVVIENDDNGKRIRKPFEFFPWLFSRSFV